VVVVLNDYICSVSLAGMIAALLSTQNNVNAISFPRGHRYCKTNNENSRRNSSMNSNNYTWMRQGWDDVRNHIWLPLVGFGYYSPISTIVVFNMQVAWRKKNSSQKKGYDNMRLKWQVILFPVHLSYSTVNLRSTY
jgi:hypothetical protein